MNLVRGIKERMGNHQTKTHKIGPYHLHVVRQIAEGGFSYVFLVKDSNTSKHYALKRIIVRDNDELKEVKHEIDIMKLLTNHKNIVKFIDYNHSKSSNEIFILMEYCSGGHLVDLMMKRQQNRFSEKEVIGIFSDICESVAHMHSVGPSPIIHRDLKVENVLLDEESGLYKLCDFGSATRECTYINNKADMQLAEEDIQRHTTPQYRPPEMVDLYRSKVINEKVDIWALGCLLYKLLFYTTPFEEAGSLGILNGNYTIPQSIYSADLINLIRFMLHPDLLQRPDIYYVTNTVMKMRGLPPLYPNKGMQYINPFTSPIPTNNSNGPSINNNNNNNILNTSTVNTSPPTQQPSLSSRDDINKLHKAKPLPQPPKPQAPPPQSPQVDMTAFNDFELSNSQFGHQNAQSDDDISPHLKRRSPNQQQQQYSNAYMNRRANYKTTPSNTPNINGIPSSNVNHIPNNNKMESPMSSFNLEPTSSSTLDNGTINIEDVSNLVNILTVPGDIPIDQESLIKLKSYTNFSKGVMGEIVKRPLREPVVCLKSLLIVHKLLVEGLPQFKSDAYDSRDLFHNLHLGWLKQKEKFSLVSEYLSQYSLLIHRLVLFHQKYYFVEGSFSFDESRWGTPDQVDSSSHPISTVAVSSLLGVLDQVVHTQSSIADTAMSATANIPLGLVVQSVTLLNTQSYAIYCFVNGCLGALTRISETHQHHQPGANEVANLIVRFQNTHQQLRDQYHRLSTLPPFATEIFFPTLQKTPPIFNHPQATASSLSSSGSHPHPPPLLRRSSNPFDSGTTEPTFNPFDDNFTSPIPSPRISGNSIPPSFVPPSNITSNSGSHSPVNPRRNNQVNQVPLVRGFPHSTSLDDARLYTLILTPSPSPPLSPSFNRLAYSNSNIAIGQQQQQQQAQQVQQPPTIQLVHSSSQQHVPSSQQGQQGQQIDSNNFLQPFTGPNILSVSGGAANGNSNTNNNLHHQPPHHHHHQHHQHQQHYSSHPNSGSSTPSILNSSTNSVSSNNPFDQQSPMYQQPPPHKSTNALMPPTNKGGVGGGLHQLGGQIPMGGASNSRGHRRSQSSTTDDMRRRNLLQQQLEQNREFVQHQRQVLTNQRNQLNNNNTNNNNNNSNNVVSQPPTIVNQLQPSSSISHTNTFVNNNPSGDDHQTHIPKQQQQQDINNQDDDEDFEDDFDEQLTLTARKRGKNKLLLK